MDEIDRLSIKRKHGTRSYPLSCTKISFSTRMLHGFTEVLRVVLVNVTPGFGWSGYQTMTNFTGKPCTSFIGDWESMDEP